MSHSRLHRALRHLGHGLTGKIAAAMAIAACHGLIFAPIASARTAFPVYGANGDAGATDECPAGQYFVGVVGNVGAWVDQITVICAERKPDGSISGGKSLPSRGGTGGGFRKEMCDKDEVITRIYVSRTGDYQTRGLDFTCKNVKTNATHVLYFGGNARTDGDGREMACGPTEAATGMRIQWGKYVNGLGLICNNIPASPPGIQQVCNDYASRMMARLDEANKLSCAFLKGSGGWNEPRDHWVKQCLGFKGGGNLIKTNEQGLQSTLDQCKSAQAGGGVPAEWAEMLKAHNDLRKQHCSPPLQWDAGLAKAAEDYAKSCKLGVHSGPNENLATAFSVSTTSNGVTTDILPAKTDVAAFTDTWSCEEQFYPYNDPKICGGFKRSCNEPKPECGGNPVTGHYTQVVWKSATKVGCGRATCDMTDDNGKTHKGTNWVCHYDQGNNPQDPTTLRQNVMPVGCKPEGLRGDRVRHR